MKTCPTCLTEISEDLNTCPHCNENLKKEPEPSVAIRKSRFFGSNKIKSFLAATVVLLIVIGGSTLIPRFLKQHKTRFLRKSQAYVQLGDKKAAIPLLKKHLLLNPGDTNNKFIYGGLLEDAGEKQNALAVYKAILMSNPEANSDGRARSAINLIYWGFMDEQTELAKKNIDSKRFDTGRECYKKISEYINALIENENCNLREIEKLPLDKFVTLKLLFDKYEEIKAQYVFSYWLEGKWQEGREIAFLSGGGYSSWDVPGLEMVFIPEKFWEKEKFKRDSNYYLAGLLNDAAISAFHAKKWAPAIEGYGNASEYYEASKLKALAAECVYNQAMAYWNNDQVALSRTVLAKLKEKYPDYEPADVRKQIVDSQKASLRITALNYLKEAHKYFDKDQWINARVSFYKAIEYYEKAGEPDNSELMGEERLNIAYTYFNQKDYAKAKEILLELQEKNPSFEPMLIKEQLARVEKLLK